MLRSWNKTLREPIKDVVPGIFFSISCQTHQRHFSLYEGPLITKVHDTWIVVVSFAAAPNPCAYFRTMLAHFQIWRTSRSLHRAPCCSWNAKSELTVKAESWGVCFCQVCEIDFPRGLHLKAHTIGDIKLNFAHNEASSGTIRVLFY